MNEKPIILSERMKAITTMVTPGNRVCDIGCDHGYISIFLVQQKISPNVIACDINKGPLSRAQENIEAYCLEQYIETRLSDGLNALAKNEAETMICAGMGGKLMQHILCEGRQLAKSFQELILQPQSEIKQFREFLRKEGYQTLSENMVKEDGKFYPIIKVKPIQSEIYDEFGQILLEEKNETLFEYLIITEKNLLEIKNKLEGLDGEKSRRRFQEIEKELERIQIAKSFF